MRALPVALGGLRLFLASFGAPRLLAPSRARCLLGAALLHLSLVGYGMPQRVASAEMISEPASGRLFPIELAVPGRGQVHRLAGTGIRTKTLFKVQVYAIGLYLDPEIAKPWLPGWSQRSITELQNDQSFYDTMLTDNFGKSLRLVTTRTIQQDDMIGAFREALAARLAHATERLRQKGSQADLDRFRNLFSFEELPEEAELIFSCLPDGVLATSIQGEVKGEIGSPALCWALFDVYLGSEPISKGAKKSLISRIPSILRSRK